ncbi:MAG: hypothetical protein K2W95_11150 [Candidatus Obscuribacterales bacterium]|nr:hypothetical protein [Candidatus Obscuribacterales bacterium]
MNQTKALAPAILFLILSSTITDYACAADSAEPQNLPSVTKELLIHAPMAKVWQAIQTRRNSSTNRKEMSYTNNEAVVHERFPALPIVGDIDCTYEEDEQRAANRIEYHMLNSNHFREFQGCYQLRLAADGVSTILALTSTVDPGIRIPFWQKIARAAAEKSVRETLQEIAILSGDR